MLLELVDRRARRSNEAELRIDRDMCGLSHVVLVLDVAHDLLDQIFNGDEAVGAAVLVNDQCHVDAGRLHADEEVRRRHGWRNVEHGPTDLRRADGPREIDAAEVEVTRRALIAARLGGLWRSGNRYGQIEYFAGRLF